MSDEKKDLEQYAKDLGKRLGFLIASLDVSNEIKEAILNTIKDFDLTQLEKFTVILEDKFLSEKTNFVEEELVKQLEKISKETQEKEDELNKNTIKRLSI